MGQNLLQGKFIPKNPGKYKGNVRNIHFRSSWERVFMRFLDDNPAVVKWSSEEIVIPYRSPKDNQVHRYFPDFWFRAITNIEGNEFAEYLVEIKPFKQTHEPKQRSRVTRKYLTEVMNWGINSSKWEAARAYCEKNNMEFKILTERDLFKTWGHRKS